MIEELEELRDELSSYILLSSLVEDDFKIKETRNCTGYTFYWKNREMISLYKSQKVKLNFRLRFEEEEMWLKYIDILERLKGSLTTGQYYRYYTSDANWNRDNLYGITIEMQVLNKRDSTRYIYSIIRG